MSGSFFIGDQDYSETTRNVDLMLEQFSKDRSKITNLLKTNPDTLVSTLWNYNSPISKDDDCLFQMGKSLSLSIADILEKKSDISDSMINYYVCPQCKNMKRLIDFKKTKEGEPFILECGEKGGSSLYYEEKDISLYLIKEREPKSVKEGYQNLI